MSKITLMPSFKARISKLEKNIKPRNKLYKIYWADGQFNAVQYQNLLQYRPKGIVQHMDILM